MYSNLRKKLIKHCSEIFKDDLDPSDCLNIPPVKITLKSGHEKMPKYNARVPISTPRYLEKAANKEQARIMKSGHWRRSRGPLRQHVRLFL